MVPKTELASNLSRKLEWACRHNGTMGAVAKKRVLKSNPLYDIETPINVKVDVEDEAALLYIIPLQWHTG